MKGALLLLALLPGPALAQSQPASPQGPGWYYGYQPSNVGFNSAFAAKQDWPMPSSTVAGLPACTSGLRGQWYMITDATTPTYNAALAGSGAVVVPAICNGTSWTSH